MSSTMTSTRTVQTFYPKTVRDEHGKIISKKSNKEVKNQILNSMLSMCRSKKLEDLTEGDKEFIQSSFKELEKQSSEWFYTADSASKIYASTCLYIIFNGGSDCKFNTELCNVKTFMKEKFDISIHDDKDFAWGRNMSQKYFSKIIDYLANRTTTYSQNIMSDSVFNFLEIYKKVENPITQLGALKAKLMPPTPEQLVHKFINKNFIDENFIDEKINKYFEYIEKNKEDLSMVDDRHFYNQNQETNLLFMKIIVTENIDLNFNTYQLYLLQFYNYLNRYSCNVLPECLNKFNDLLVSSAKNLLNSFQTNKEREDCIIKLNKISKSFQISINYSNQITT